MYKRVLLKLSGEALKGGDTKHILDAEYLQEIVQVIKRIHEDGTQVAIVIGAGNIWRGKVAEKLGIDRVNADYMGMMGTVINAVATSSALKVLGVPSIVFSAIPEIDGVTQNYEKNLAKTALNCGNVVFLAGGTGKPYFTTDTAATLRALELECDAILMGKNGVDGVYTDDPNTNPNAEFIKDITYDEILEKNLSVMDKSAVELIKDKDIDIRVFNMANLDNFEKVIAGDTLGTTCHRKGK